MQTQELKIGDEVTQSAVGAGVITEFTDLGYPKVNDTACTWVVLADGAVHDPLGNMEKFLEKVKAAQDAYLKHIEDELLEESGKMFSDTDKFNTLLLAAVEQGPGGEKLEPVPKSITVELLEDTPNRVALASAHINILPGRQDFVIQVSPAWTPVRGDTQEGSDPVLVDFPVDANSVEASVISALVFVRTFLTEFQGEEHTNLIGVCEAILDPEWAKTADAIEIPSFDPSALDDVPLPEPTSGQEEPTEESTEGTIITPSPVITPTA